MDPSPFTFGLPENLMPHPPADMPEVLGPGDPMAAMSPFSEPQDVDSIKAAITLDRPLKMFIPDREKYPNHEFRVINSSPQEIVEAARKGMRPTTEPTLTRLFDNLVAGTDKEGKIMRPVLCAREKPVGEHLRQMIRRQLKSLYAGLDPRNRDFGAAGSRVENVTDGKDRSKGDFTGAGWRIKV